MNKIFGSVWFSLCVMAMFCAFYSGEALADLCSPGVFEPNNRNGVVYNPSVDKCSNGKVLQIHHELCLPGEYYAHPMGLPIEYNPAVDNCSNGYVYPNTQDICPKIYPNGRLFIGNFNPAVQYCIAGDVKYIPKNIFDSVSNTIDANSATSDPSPEGALPNQYGFFPDPGLSKKYSITPPKNRIGDRLVFPDAKLTLGQMAMLVDFSYASEDLALVSLATLGKLKLLAEKYARKNNSSISDDDKKINILRSPIVNAAVKSEQNRIVSIQNNLVAKKRFLADINLIPVALPKNARSRIRLLNYNAHAVGLEILNLEGTSEYYITVSVGVDSIDMVKNLVTDNLEFRLKGLTQDNKFERIQDDLYDPLFNIIDEFVKKTPNSSVHILGHGKGASIAQVVSIRSSARAVVFNSFPLPIKYSANVGVDTASKIRSYSSVYPFVSKDLTFIPDPISIKHNLATSTILNISSGSKFVAQMPECLLVTPEPWFNDDENSYINHDLYGVFFSPALLDVRQLTELGVFFFATKSAVWNIMYDDIWKTGSLNVDSPIVRDNANRVLGDQASSLAMKAAGVAGDLHVLWDAATDHWIKALKGLGTKALFKSGISAYKRTIVAHSMSRFARGLYSSDESQVSNFVGFAGERAWTKQCDLNLNGVSAYK